MAMEGIIQTVLVARRALGKDCPLEDTVALCTDLTWNQVFLAIDYLSRTGHVRVTRDFVGSYRVHVVESPVVPALG